MGWEPERGQKKGTPGQEPMIRVPIQPLHQTALERPLLACPMGMYMERVVDRAVCVGWK